MFVVLFTWSLSCTFAAWTSRDSPSGECNIRVAMLSEVADGLLFVQQMLFTVLRVRCHSEMRWCKAHVISMLICELSRWPYPVANPKPQRKCRVHVLTSGRAAHRQAAATVSIT